MNPIDFPDLHHFRAAQGWLELGNLYEANVELDKISPETRLHPDVLEVQWHICFKVNLMSACMEIGSMLVRFAPERSDSWIHYTYALHCLGRTNDALDILVPVAHRFYSVWQVPYNLSCFCSSLGRFDDARGWFKIALSIDDKAAQKACIDEPDLEPLWDNTSSTIWKKAEPIINESEKD
ncbi:MAG TPA: tetratricopeptide repeat protein [Verrucomicrobiae bacterium]|nr:tetratricopeptide repeat protein [Verrucomicrobiae bacterium]